MANAGRGSLLMVSLLSRSAVIESLTAVVWLHVWCPTSVYGWKLVSTYDNCLRFISTRSSRCPTFLFFTTLDCRIWNTSLELPAVVSCVTSALVIPPSSVDGIALAQGVYTIITILPKKAHIGSMPNPPNLSTFV